MKSLRTGFGVALGFFVLLGVAGVLDIAVGEWNARRQLPPEIRTPEAIQRYYDGLVCLGCYLRGGIVLMICFLAGVVVLLMWGAAEVVNRTPRKSGEGQVRDRQRAA